MKDLNVIIPAHNPDPERLSRTLGGLDCQSLDRSRWDITIVDNASTSFPSGVVDRFSASLSITVLQEPRLGLTQARLAGLAATTAPLIVLVDDDNVLAGNYLDRAVAFFQEDPGLGAAGGPVRPSFEQPPAASLLEFLPLLALRDFGSRQLRTHLAPGEKPAGYPEFAPIGAGMVLRRECATAYRDALSRNPRRGGFDRRGASLASGGDNDLILTLLGLGWQAGYFPELAVTHLIPRRRVQPDYLAELQHEIARSWVLVLNEHGIRPWPRVSPRTLWARKTRAWFRHGAWRGGAARIRWRGACGSFEARALLPS